MVLDLLIFIKARFQPETFFFNLQEKIRIANYSGSRINKIEKWSLSSLGFLMDGSQTDFLSSYNTIQSQTKLMRSPYRALGTDIVILIRFLFSSYFKFISDFERNKIATFYNWNEECPRCLRKKAHKKGISEYLTLKWNDSIIIKLLIHWLIIKMRKLPRIRRTLRFKRDCEHLRVV